MSSGGKNLTTAGRSWDAQTLVPFDCPKCGERLDIFVGQTVGHDPDRIISYLCPSHGFFTFDMATGLRPGL